MVVRRAKTRPHDLEQAVFAEPVTFASWASSWSW